jgi:3-oxoacyl-[acyl-carrier protein] reductase
MGGRLEGKVAVVTGGSRGIGAAISRTLAREGAAVVINFTSSAEKAQALVDAIVSDGGRAMAFHADVASKPAVEAMAAATAKQFGAVDVLVNNAGILRPGTTLKLTDDDLDEMIDVNLKGMIYAVQAIAPGMIERRYGKVVNVASIAGLGTSVDETTPYAMTKAAVISLTKRLAFELGRHNINVNAIAPGFIKTEMLQGLESDRARLEALSRKAVLNRVGTPEDVANLALFLASEDSSYMTAQVLTLDGGRTDFLTHST